MAAHSPLTEFALLARAPDDALDLEQLALCVARIGNPGLDPRAVSAELDRLAAQVDDAITPSAPPDVLAAQLARALGGTLGFAGTANVFGHPESSYLDRVLATRTGLPILLAVVWMLLGRRLGVPILGIGYPGHFLAALDLPGARIYLDPFAGGAPREPADLLDRLPAGAERIALEPSPVRAIVTRMLTNLKHLWVDKREHALALGAVDRLLLLGGEVPTQLRDRGLLAIQLGRTAEGVRDLERYIALAPTAADRTAVERLLALRSRPPRDT